MESLKENYAWGGIFVLRVGWGFSFCGLKIFFCSMLDFLSLWIFKNLLYVFIYGILDFKYVDP